MDFRPHHQLAMYQHPVRERTFLEDLEMRQDEVLDQLADLERRVESLLNECAPPRDETAPGAIPA
jgi:hypothetical protein